MSEFRSYGEYGVAYSGSSLHLVTLTTASGNLFVIGNFIRPEHFPASYLAKMADNLEKRATECAADQSCDRFIDEALAYVRSLPDGCRSPYMDDDDPEWLASSLADIRSGLKIALVETDAYRAARNFEASVPYLIADIGLIELMEPILHTFHKEVDDNLAQWIERAAEHEQRRVLDRSPFIASAAARLREAFEGASLISPQ